MQDKPKRDTVRKLKPSRLNDAGLLVGSAGKGLGYARKALARYQAALLRELETRGVALDVGTASLVQSVLRWELTALVATKLCRSPELTALERAALVRQIASASSERDKVLARLGLDRPDDTLRLDGDPFPASAPDQTQIVDSNSEGNA